MSERLGSPHQEAALAIRFSIRVPGRSRKVLLWEGDGAEISVGRSTRADLLLPDPGVSGLHLLLRYEGDRRTYRMQDEGSLNGTRLNGRPLGPEGHDLTAQDRISLGGVLLTVEAMSPPGEPAGRSPSLPALETAAQVEQMLHQPAATPAALRHWLSAGGAWLRPRLPAGLDALILLLGLAAAVMLIWVAVGR